MRTKAANTKILSTIRLLATAASRTGLRREAFVLQLHRNAQPFKFVGEIEPHLAGRHLVDALVRCRAVVHMLSDVAHISNRHSSHACLMQRGDKGFGLLVVNDRSLKQAACRRTSHGSDGLAVPRH